MATMSWQATVESMRAHWRADRMRAFGERMTPRDGMRVLDIGGNIEMWSTLDVAVDLTLLNTNLERAAAHRPWLAPSARLRWRAVSGDGCDLREFADQSFDIVFSNSVIEHVGDDARVAAFAREAQRVGKGYWVQTPARSFPIEAHSRLPFYWSYPQPLRAQLAARIDARRRDEPWHCPLDETRSFSLATMRQLFPSAQLYTERVLGLAKSWSLYRAPDSPKTISSHRSSGTPPT